MTTKSTHILVIPYPAQGHMIPLLDFTHHLATTTTTTATTTITVVTTPKNLHILTPLLTATPNVTPLVLPFPLPLGAENTKDLPAESFRKLIPALSRLEEPLGHWFESHPSPPVVVVSDFFLGWTQRFAEKYGIKRVVFSPSGAMALSVIYALWRDMPKINNNVGSDQNGVVLFSDLPNCPKYPWCQLSTVYRSYVEGDVESEVIKDGFRDNMVSWGLVVNTFDELERVYLSHLMSALGHERVWAVGPLFPPHGLKDRGGSSSVDPDSILSWLDTCRDNEVVYVSFGTQALLSVGQKAAVAEALEKSGVRFIWSVRDHATIHGLDVAVKEQDSVFHGGFEDRVAGRGLIIKGWAPQVSILKHRAVGTFLTHCGWNSILEGIMSNVGMLAWPMGADQFTNATLIVDLLRVGVRISEGPKTVPDPIGLARIIAQSINGDILNRQKIEKLHASCLEALKEDGSSTKGLGKFVSKLSELKSREMNCNGQN